MRYKNFDLSIGLQGVLGNKIYNATRQTLEDVTKGSNFWQVAWIIGLLKNKKCLPSTPDMG